MTNVVHIQKHYIIELLSLQKVEHLSKSTSTSESNEVQH